MVGPTAVTGPSAPIRVSRAPGTSCPSGVLSPIWSASRRGTAEENAQRAFDRNGETFGARDLDDFVRKAHAFIETPPAGTQRLTRANGDVLLYDPKGNVFAVASKDGAPRTMFKPDEGAAYWDEQKSRLARQATRRSGDNGES